MAQQHHLRIHISSNGSAFTKSRALSSLSSSSLSLSSWLLLSFLVLYSSCMVWMMAKIGNVQQQQRCYPHLFLHQPQYQQPMNNMNNVVWKWYFYSQFHGNNMNNMTSKTTTTTKKNLLVAQYSSWNEPYTSLLQEASVVNRAYCRLHGYDYVQYQGIAYAGEYPNNNNSNEIQSAFGKIFLLEQALWKFNTSFAQPKKQQEQWQWQQSYQWILILDAYSIIYNLSTDIVSLAFMPEFPPFKNTNNVNNDVALVAHAIDPPPPRQNNNNMSSLLLSYHHYYHYHHTWNINNGVTLWNLEHPATHLLCQKWKDKTLDIWRQLQQQQQQRSLTSSLSSLPSSHLTHTAQNDQRILRLVLKQRPELTRRHVFGLTQNEFAPGVGGNLGTVVRHFARPNSKSWNKDDKSDGTDCIMRLRTAVQYVCHHYHPACQGL